MTQRFEGHNLDDALQKAAEALGVERYQIRHSVIVEKRGFLGGTKRIVIEAEADLSRTPPPVYAVAPSSPPAGGRRERPRTGGGGGGGGRGRGGDRGGRGGREFGGGERHGGRGFDEDDRGRRRSRGPRVPVDLPEQGPESEPVLAIRDWCEELFDLAGMDLIVRTDEEAEQVNIRLYGRDADMLTEGHGELLDAVQVIANKVFVGRKLEKDIEFDAAGFKAQRIQDLEAQAREAADKVRRDGREQLFPAMSPIERRIVHMALRDDADVTTESRGEGFFKRVAVIPRPAEAAPTEP